MSAAMLLLWEREFTIECDLFLCMCICVYVACVSVRTWDNDDLCMCVLAYSHVILFILTAAVLSGVCKEASDSKRLTHDVSFFTTESASHNW